MQWSKIIVLHRIANVILCLRGFIGVVIFIGLIVAGLAGIGYLLWSLIGQFVNLGSVEDLDKALSLPRLFVDTDWKMTGWKIFAMLGVVLIVAGWMKQISFRFNTMILRRSNCVYCGQWHSNKKTADQCCVSSPPTNSWMYGWFRRHKLLTKQDAWKYGISIVVTFGLLWSGLATLFKISTLSWSWWWTTAGVSGWVGYSVYTAYKTQKPCAECRLLSDYDINTAWPLCSRCYAKRERQL